MNTCMSLSDDSPSVGSRILKAKSFKKHFTASAEGKAANVRLWEDNHFYDIIFMMTELRQLHYFCKKH